MMVSPALRLPLLRPGLALLLLVTLCACGREATGGPLDPGLRDAAFEGPLRVSINSPDGESRQDAGRAGARLEHVGDRRMRIVVSGSIAQEGDAGFVMEGAVDANGWSASHEGVQLHLAPDGQLRGGGRLGDQQLELEGTVDAERFDLETTIELAEASGGGFPAGTRFSFRYALERVADPEAADEMVNPDGTATRRTAEMDDCKEIVWRLRNVPNLSGGAMSLVRVPVCVQ